MREIMNLMKKEKLFKRVLDLAVALSLLVALAPVIISIAAFNYFYFGKILFVQCRIGLHEGPFKIYKFKTIFDHSYGKEQLGEGLSINRWGKFLRKSGIDELPQLWNIIRGDLSLVGPRPLLPEYLLIYSDKERIRHNVKPGVTGLAQIKGGNSLDWQERLLWDSIYVKHGSLKLDLFILLKTIPYLLNRDSVHISDSLTRYKGSLKTKI